MKKRQILPILAAFVPLFSSVATGAPLLQEKFQSFVAGDSLPIATGTTPGTWLFQPLKGGSGTATIEKPEGGEAFLKVREASGEGLRGSWHLYRILEPLPPAGQKVTLDVRFRVNNPSLAYDWIFGPIDRDFRALPSNTNCVAIFRVRNNQTTGRIEMSYWSPDLKGGEGAYSTPFATLTPGQWVKFQAVIDPAKSEMSLRLTGADGTVMAERGGIPLKSPVAPMAGVVFKNRQADLNAVDFDLAEVVMESSSAPAPAPAK